MGKVFSKSENIKIKNKKEIENFSKSENIKIKNNKEIEKFILDEKKAIEALW